MDRGVERAAIGGSAATRKRYHCRIHVLLPSKIDRILSLSETRCTRGRQISAGGGQANHSRSHSRLAQQPQPHATGQLLKKGSAAALEVKGT